MGAISPWIQPKPGVSPVFEAAFGHELHADTDAEKGAAGGDGLVDGVAQAGDRGEAARAVAEGALAGEDDAVGGGDLVGGRR